MAIWQKHWSNTASDPRMQWLLTEMGVRGYGIYWLISERLTACEQGAILQQHLVHDMRSRQLNSQYILQVINNYFLFETDEGGYVRHHRVLIGYMNAHTLHQLKTGQLSPALLDCATNAQPTPIHRTANAQSNGTLYNVRAGKNRKYIIVSFEEHIDGKRYADGKPIPFDAPPRPSATALWDAGAHQWTEI